VVMLIDDRFAETKVQRLLPQWWSVKSERHNPTCGSELLPQG
jgi:Rad3-related DNA helicase